MGGGAGPQLVQGVQQRILETHRLAAGPRQQTRRLLLFAESPVRLGQGIAHDGRVRLQTEGLLETPDGGAVRSRRRFDLPQEIVGQRALRVDPEGLLERFAGPLLVAEIAQDLAQPHPRRQVAGLQLESAAKDLRRRLEAARALQHHAEVVGPAKLLGSEAVGVAVARLGSFEKLVDVETPPQLAERRGQALGADLRVLPQVPQLGDLAFELLANRGLHGGEIGPRHGLELRPLPATALCRERRQQDYEASRAIHRYPRAGSDSGRPR